MTENANYKRLLFWLSISVLFFVFVFLIRSILLPFVLGIFTAYFLDPAADRLQRARLSRTASTAIITVAFFLSLTTLTVLVAPVLFSQLSGLIAALPEYVARVEAEFAPELQHWVTAFPSFDMQGVKSAVTGFSGVMLNFAAGFIAGLFQSGMAIVNLISLILITPVVAFYLLRDWDHIMARLDMLLPRQHAETVRHQLSIVDNTLAGFVRGQLNVCLLMGLYYGIGLTIVDLKFGIIIGFITGLLVIIPYVGFLFGFLTGMAVAFFQFEAPAQIIAVFTVFMIGQVIEGMFITPKLVGDKVGLHPVWIIFGMLAGAALFGFVGVLLAVPITAVIGVMIRFAIQNYLDSSYYHGDRQRPARK